MKKLFLMLALALVTFTAAAWDRPEQAKPVGEAFGQFQLKNHTVTVFLAEEVTAPASLTQDDFAILLAYKLNAFTAQTEHEYCAPFFKLANGDWYAPVYTVGSHKFCPQISNSPRDGVTAVGVDIHSHVKGRWLPNPVDDLFRTSKTRGSREKISNPYPCEFSDGDFDGTDGYMTCESMLQFQSGITLNHSKRKVWKMTDPQPGTSTAVAAK